MYRRVINLNYRKMDNIQENNSLIARFMGYELITPQMRKKPHSWKYSYWENKDETGFKRVLGEEKRLKYHASWDSLMTVLDKIESFKNINGDEYLYAFSILPMWTSVVCNLTGENIYTSKGRSNSRFEETYEAVVEFIKLYNKNKSQ